MLVLIWSKSNVAFMFVVHPLSMLSSVSLTPDVASLLLALVTTIDDAGRLVDRTFETVPDSVLAKSPIELLIFDYMLLVESSFTLVMNESTGVFLLMYCPGLKESGNDTTRNMSL